MKKNIVLLTVIGLLVLAFALWMNRYIYHQKGVMTVRINRFTSQVCYSQPDGTWNSNLYPEDSRSRPLPGLHAIKQENKCE